MDVYQLSGCDTVVRGNYRVENLSLIANQVIGKYSPSYLDHKTSWQSLAQIKRNSREMISGRGRDDIAAAFVSPMLL